MQLTRKAFLAFLAGAPLAAKAVPQIAKQTPHPRTATGARILECSRPAPAFHWSEHNKYRPLWAEVHEEKGLGPFVIITDNPSLFSPGDLFVVPTDLESNLVSELIRVQGIEGNRLIVQRDIHGTGRNPIFPKTWARIIGSSFEDA